MAGVDRNRIHQVTRPGWLALWLIVGAAACDEADANFTAKMASDFAPARHTVSVLGLYKDGLMSSEGWGAVAPFLGPALGGGPCEVGYDALVSSNPPLAEAIDEFARADGPTDDLIGHLSAAARGDLVLVMTFAGKLPHRPTDDGGALAPSVASPGMGTGGSHSMGGNSSLRGRPRPEPPQDTNAVDISASLYSVRQQRSVAMVALRYSGATLDDALRKFGDKLGQTLPQMQCVGWNWGVPIDPARLRADMDK